MKKSELRQIVKEIVEELCAKVKAYRKKRMAAGEKSSAYLSGRAVKVCKGQMKGENVVEYIDALDEDEDYWEDPCGCSDPGCPCDGFKRGGPI